MADPTENPFGPGKFYDPEWSKAGGGYYSFTGAPAPPPIDSELWPAWHKSYAKFKEWDAAHKAQGPQEPAPPTPTEAKPEPAGTIPKAQEPIPQSLVDQAHKLALKEHEKWASHGMPEPQEAHAYDDLLTSQTNPTYHDYFTDNGIKLPWSKPAEPGLPEGVTFWHIGNPEHGKTYKLGDLLEHHLFKSQPELQDLSVQTNKYYSSDAYWPELTFKGAKKLYPEKIDWPSLNKENLEELITHAHQQHVIAGGKAPEAVVKKLAPIAKLPEAPKKLPPFELPPKGWEAVTPQPKTGAALAPFHPQSTYTKETAYTRAGDTPQEINQINWWNDLTGNEQHAVRSWVRGSYAIKQVQQHGNKPEWLAKRNTTTYPKEYWEEIDKRVPEFESAIAKAPTLTGTFYRGMHSLKPEDVAKFNNLAAVFENGAHSSVSLEPSGAEYFSHRYGTPGPNNQSIKMTFNNTNARGLNPTDMLRIPGTPGEKEAILEKGQQFNIDSVTPHQYGQWMHGITFSEIPKEADTGERPRFKFMERALPGMLELTPEADVIMALAQAPEMLHEAYGWFPKSGVEPSPEAITGAPSRALMTEMPTSGRPPVKPGTAGEFHKGGKVPGKGDKDSIKAALTPGEFVVNKKATEEYLPLLEEINARAGGRKQNGSRLHFQAGGIVPTDPAAAVMAVDQSNPYALPQDTEAATAPTEQQPATQIEQPEKPRAPNVVQPTGGTAGDEGIYSPSKPNYLSYNPLSNTGLNDMMKFFQNIYSKANEPGRTPEPRHSLDTTPLSPDTAGDTGGTITTDTPSSLAGDHTDGFNKLSGWATTFGLQPNTVVNDDGTVDVKYYDPEDNGWGAFGYNTRDPKLVGGSLPVDVLTQSIGDYIHDPAIIRQIKNGDYKIAVTNANGQTEIVPIVDAGPANWTGNLVDLTWAAQKKLGLSGKDQVDVQLIGPAGATIPIKGFNPGTVARQAGETRHGTAFTKEREAETEEPEKTEEQKYAEEHSSYPAANVLTNEQRAALLAKLSPDEQATIRTWDSMSPEDQAKRSASDPAWAQKLHDIAIHLNTLRGRTAPPAPTKMTNIVLPSGGAPPKTEQPKEGTKAHLLSTLEKAQKALAQGTNRLDEVQ